jgi:hypothetical protein
MNNLIIESTNSFLEGINTNPYNNRGVEYNMYSYASLQQSEVGYQIVGDINSPVGSGDSFPIPDGFSASLSEGDGAPYIGTIEDSGTKYIALTDCSGYIIYIVAQANEVAMNELVQGAINGRGHMQPWPSAAQIAQYAGGQNWQQVLDSDGSVDFGLIQPGDIIAWDESGNTQDTGHVAIALSPSVQQSDGSYNVEISDSTVLQHLNNQRNGIKKGNDPTGVGKGIIGLKSVDGALQSNFYPGTDPWVEHPHINILRLV